VKVRRVPGRPIGAGLLAVALAGCNQGSTGFVQIKTVPVSAVAQPVLYFDSTKLEPLRKGEAVLTRRVGTTRLQADGAGGTLTALCEIVVKKNRITTVIVSVAERPPRCQCANTAVHATTRTCVG
jgi:hypothetical protein